MTATPAQIQYRLSPQVISHKQDLEMMVRAGKTTCAVFRMWARWHSFYQHSAEPFNQVCAPAPSVGGA